MKVQSTGLGKSVMIAHLHGLLMAEFEEEKVVQITMESTEPLHWYIQVYMEPKDVRRAVVLGLKSSVLWKGLMAIVFGRFSLFSKGVSAEAPVGGVSGKAEVEAPPAAAPAPPPDESGGVSPLAKLKG